MENADKIRDGEHADVLLLLVVPKGGGADAIVDKSVECLREGGR